MSNENYPLFRSAEKYGMEKVCKIGVYFCVLLFNISLSGQQFHYSSKMFDTSTGLPQDSLNLKGKQFHYNYRMLDTSDGLPQNSVNAMLQDEDGFIWMATSDGLGRFDGYEFRNYLNIPKDSTSIGGNYLGFMINDPSSDIWVVIGDGSVCRYNTKTEQFRHYNKIDSGNHGVFQKRGRSLFLDSEGRVWLGHSLGLDLYDPENDVFKTIWSIDSDISDVRGHGVCGISEDSKHRIWVLTMRNGLLQLNGETLEVESTYQMEGNEDNLYNHATFRMFYDDYNTLWFGFNIGMWKFNPDVDERPVQLEDIFVMDFMEWTKSGNLLYVALNGDFVSFDPVSNRHETLDTSKLGLKGAQIRSAFEDDTGSLWIGTLNEGAIYMGKNAKPFQFRSRASGINKSKYGSTQHVIKLYEDSGGYIWGMDKDKGVIRKDPKSGNITSYPGFANSFEYGANDVFDIMEDSLGFIWFLGFSNVVRFNPKDESFKYFDNLDRDNNDTTDDHFLKICETSNGLVWLLSILGDLIALDVRTGEERKRYEYDGSGKPTSLPGKGGTVIYEGLDDTFYIGIDEAGLFLLDQENGVFKKVPYELGMSSIVGLKNPQCLYQGERDVLWIGTANGLVRYDIKSGRGVRYGIADGLPNNFIYDVLDDGKGYLWLTTNMGISRFDPKTLEFKNYDAGDGLNQSEYIFQSSFMSKTSGLMYLGGTRGYNFFDPSEIRDNDFIPQIAITSFRKNDVGKGLIDVPGANHLEEIVLDYGERDFFVEYAALDYTNPGKNRYAHKLEGYNDDWLYTGNKRDVAFTSLRPGLYTLRLKGSNNDGIWNESGRSLRIKILPPWWSTPWAYLVYGLLGASLLYGAYRYRYSQLETYRLKELDEAKKTMFTNLTHEFRTPLTVITGINRSLREHFGGERSGSFDLIERNSQGLLHLVNQLLELRKIEVGKTRMHYVQGDIVGHLRYIGENFRSYADTNGISYHFVPSVAELVMDHDPDKLLMVLSNLLSNAIKYSEEGDNVYLQVDLEGNTLRFSVMDSGIGIPAKELPYIFERFRKADSLKRDHAEGMGVGLAITKKLVSLMGGDITVNSQMGKGTVFTVFLPISRNAPLADKSQVSSEDEVFIPYFPVTVDEGELSLETERSEGLPTVLVIEDNKDIATYIVSCLKGSWNVEVALDGLTGVEKAVAMVPDVILSDLMMPGLNGYEVLSKVRGTECTSHVPVVLLTAKVDSEARVKAYEKGVDAYLEKPFEEGELLAILKNLVDQRRVLRERYAVTYPYLDSLEGAPQKEDGFVLKLEELVLGKGLSPEYNIQSLCKDLGMSRTQLHNKVKALTGLSTSHFIRSVRLRKAKYLLRNTERSVSEIAYEVGFNHTSYFTRTFTSEFGMTPSAYRK